MSKIPRDALAPAQFLMRYLYRPVEVDGERLFAFAETERPCMGDIWFWTDDNAKVLELLSRPEVWRAFPEQTAETLRFVRAMCRAPFIFRRVSMPRLEAAGRTDQLDTYVHSLMHLRCDLQHGAIAAGIRFHDGRTADNVLLTGNMVWFSHKGRRFRVDV